MDAPQVLHRRLAARDDRLVRNNYRPVLGVVKTGNRGRGLADQMNLFGPADMSKILNQHAITIKKHGSLGMTKRPALDNAGLYVMADFFEPSGRSGIFDVFRAAIARQFLVSCQHGRKHMLVKSDVVERPL